MPTLWAFVMQICFYVGMTLMLVLASVSGCCNKKKPTQRQIKRGGTYGSVGVVGANNPQAAAAKNQQLTFRGTTIVHDPAPIDDEGSFGRRRPQIREARRASELQDKRMAANEGEYRTFKHLLQDSQAQDFDKTFVPPKPKA